MPETLRERITPFIPYTLKCTDDKGDKFEFHLKISYDFTALTLLEQRLGINVLRHFGALLEEPNTTAVLITLWAGVQKYHDDWRGEAGLKALGANLTLDSAKDAWQACIEALVSQLPEEQQAKIKANKKAIEEGKQPVQEPVAPLATAPATT